jgi:hypothetical protein
MKKRAPIVPTDSLESCILALRGQKVILDADLANLYGVPTKVFNQAIKRNARRFPDDFAFQLTEAETKFLRSQFATSSAGTNTAIGATTNWSQFVTSSKAKHRGVTYRPWAFTENGAVMAANVLNSPQAVRMSVFVVRAFIRMRGLLSGSLAAELKKLEAKLTSRLDVHEVAITEVLRRIMRLLEPPPAPPVSDKSMGFHTTMKRPTGKPATGRKSAP